MILVLPYFLWTIQLNLSKNNCTANLQKKISLYFFYFWACFPVTIKSISSLPKGFRCNIYRKCYEIVRKAFTALKNLEKKKKTQQSQEVCDLILFLFLLPWILEFMLIYSTEVWVTVSKKHTGFFCSEVTLKTTTTVFFLLSCSVSSPEI